MSECVGDKFDAGRVSEDCGREYGAGDGSHFGAGVFQFADECGHDCRVQFGFIALQVDNGIGIGEAASDDFCDAVCATVMVSCDFCSPAEIPDHLSNFFAVGCDDHIAEFRAAACGFPDILQEGASGGAEQQFARQSGGLQAGGDHADNFHGTSCPRKRAAGTRPAKSGHTQPVQEV